MVLAESSDGWVVLAVGVAAIVGSVLGFRHAAALSKFFAYSDRMRPRDPDDRRDLMRFMTIVLGFIGVGFVIISLAHLL